MKKLKKLCCAFVVGCTVALAPLAAFAAENDKLDYLALGDSLAAGMTPYQTHEKGYPDYLTSQLNKVGMLSSFNKDFAVSGYTTADILADIEANKAVPDGSGNTTDIQSAIANAEIITLDAGANDVLRQIEFDLEKMEAVVDPVKVNGAITAAGLNTNTILAKIKRLNPNADVYVMGYYNPFPVLPAQYEMQFQLLLNSLNQTIQHTVHVHGATFVPTVDVFAEHGSAFLPNPLDIHPNQDGYLAIANAFWRTLDVGKEVQFIDASHITGKTEIEYLAGKGIINGHANGYFYPNDPVTRVQSALMLYRAIVFSDEQAPNPNYSDVNESTFAYEVIAKLTEAGIFSGSNGQFNLNGQLTRAQMAKVVVEAFDLKGATERTFNDVTGDYWAKEYISILADNGISIGYQDGSFKPNQSITREEFSMMLARVLIKR